MGAERFLGCRVDRKSGEDEDDDFSLEGFHHELDDEQEDPISDDDCGGEAEERRIYWESQHLLLQEIVEQYNAVGWKLREEMKRQIEIARESSRSTLLCSLRRAAVNQLCSKGLNAALCLSHWKPTHNTPAGWHEYIEVRVNTQGKKKQIPFVVEVGFREEFRMAKASEEYKKLIKQVPEMYIGKWEHMKAIIRLLCEAAKKSAQEQNIHIGPWRNKTFMQMKWSPSSSSNHLPTTSKLA
ncbi:uncharacterized protein LOC125212515 isoform X1 [Salvia hispanica]|uniref:uncharacterized protein LOC125212515 isoform X1 n=1 Tax=Salvia hispanica TaxID=49212 RepID=UPI0020099996|nr:uncharacterized protein LOC125212515 isoform X1 [Salvia hispanica]